MDRFRSAIDVYAEALEHTAPQTVDALLALCADQIEFRDPFNHTHSKADFRHVLEHMFKTVSGLKFVVHDTIGSGQVWVLKWTFTGKIKLIGQVKIEGLSEVALNDEGLVIRHIDYWDSWAEVFCKVPGLGGLFKLIGARASA